MSDDEPNGEEAAAAAPSAEPVAPADALEELDRKLDTIAGALAAVARSQTELVAQASEAEIHRNQDALDVAQRLDALERQVLNLSQAGGGDGAAGGSSVEAVVPVLDELAGAVIKQQEDIASLHAAVSGLSAALERGEARNDDRIASLRDAAAVPVADLQALLAARTERTDSQIAALLEKVDAAVAALEGAAAGAAPPEPALPAEPAADGSVRVLADQVTERVDELGAAVQGLSWRLPELSEQLGTLGEELTSHTDNALAGMLRLLDERLEDLRGTLLDAPMQAPSGSGPAGFEAGAVMGAAQAAWNRLEQRLDSEFDDLSRQLQAMGTLIEQALATAEAAANRPVVTGDQLRKTAGSLKEAVMGAGRSRRDRRGGPKSLGPGDQG